MGGPAKVERVAVRGIGGSSMGSRSVEGTLNSDMDGP